MPIISIFYGIKIKVFFYDNAQHNIPHIHVEYQDFKASYKIENGDVLSGKIPSNKHKLVVAWIEIHKEDLLIDWELASNGKNVFKIRGLDA
jgi:hypothetical protein